ARDLPHPAPLRQGEPLRQPRRGRPRPLLPPRARGWHRPRRPLAPSRPAGRVPPRGGGLSGRLKWNGRRPLSRRAAREEKNWSRLADEPRQPSPPDEAAETRAEAEQEQRGRSRHAGPVAGRGAVQLEAVGPGARAAIREADEGYRVGACRELDAHEWIRKGTVEPRELGDVVVAEPKAGYGAEIPTKHIGVRERPAKEIEGRIEVRLQAMAGDGHLRVLGKGELPVVGQER